MKYSKAGNEAWLSRLDAHIQDNIDNAGFTSNHLSHLMSVSQRQLYRRVKDLTGTTPNEYLNRVRFQKALEYIQQHRYETIAEVALSVGFKDVVYFSRQFKKRFGKLPSEFFNT